MKLIITESQYEYLKDKIKYLLFEQSGKRRVFQNLKRAFSLGLKSIDPKILTNFLNFKIVDLGDFAKHFDEFSNVWLEIIPKGYNLNGITGLIKKIDVKIKTDPEWIKKIPYKKWSDIASMFPKEGGIQETVINLMLEAAGKTIKKVDVPTKYDVVKSGDEVVITTTKGTEVKQYKKDRNNNFSPITKELNNTVIINDKPLVFYHGGLPKEATIADIDVLRRSQRQQKKNSNYGGFYMSPDIEKNSFALQYHQSNPGSGLHKITLPVGSKGYNYTLDTVERIDISTLMDLQKKGYDYISGKNVFGKPEFILLNTKKADLKLISGKSIKTPEESLKILNKYGKGDGINWFTFGPDTNWSNHSGWKFHVFGTTLEDSAFLIERLTPITKKYGAHAKVGGVEQIYNIQSFKPGGIQHGKQGATIYIPQSVIDNNQHKSMLLDIQSAIQGYNNKGGKITGDKMITPQIHYRNELIGPVPNGGFINRNHYIQHYNKNYGGPYKPDNVVDIFSSNKLTKTIPINYLSTKFGDTSEIDWSKILNATNIREYDIVINDAIRTNNYSKISRGGFESYGITDFREYLKNNYNK